MQMTLNKLVIYTVVGLCLSPMPTVAQESGDESFDPTDFSGDWDRVTSIVTYSNVPGSSRSASNQQIDDVGEVEEAPFTA